MSDWNNRNDAEQKVCYSSTDWFWRKKNTNFVKLHFGKKKFSFLTNANKNSVFLLTENSRDDNTQSSAPSQYQVLVLKCYDLSVVQIEIKIMVRHFYT